jgi:hypothetical protein
MWIKNINMGRNVTMNKHTRIFLFSLACFIALPLFMQAQDGPFKIFSSDGKSAVSLGFLAQGQAEGVTNPSTDTTSKNLFLRRMRLIAGGKINDDISFFIETDSPNLGKAQADGSKSAEKVYLQDVILTYKVRNELMIDGGMLLVSGSHNGMQGATGLLPVDYGPYSFQASTPTDSKVGRDYGVQARGYLCEKHMEYRVGVYQGKRGVASSEPFRTAARLVWYPFESETGFFYTGTTLGKRKIFALGFGADNQDNYHSQAVDIFYDQPVNKGDGITLQADYTHYDGGDTFVQMKPQHVWLAEASYFFHKAKIGPFMQLSELRFARDTGANQSKYQGGLAYWPQGHRFNIKLGIGRTQTGSNPRQIQVALQTQFYNY